MDSNLGNKLLLWAGIGSEVSIGKELMNVAFELRYMIILSAVMIVTDLWWGHSDSMKRYAEAKVAGDMVGMEKYKWHKSRALRRTANKSCDYLTYLLIGTFLGLALTEPMNGFNHLYTAAIGLGIGCLAELASIVGHFCYVKLGIEVKIIDVFKWLWRLVLNIFRIKSSIGEAIEQTMNETERNKEV